MLALWGVVHSDEYKYLVKLSGDLVSPLQTIMKKVEYTWTETYTIFEPGDKVKSIYHLFLDASLDDVYIVERCTEPKFAGDTPIVFLQGIKKGQDASHFKLVE
jgi:hypothetical protein